MKWLKKLRKSPLLKNSRFSKTNLLVFIAVFAAIGSYFLISGRAASTAEIWVAPTGNDATCVRGDSTKPCLTFNQAYQIAQPGDTVQVACGNYDKQSFSIKTISGPAVVFQPTTPLCATIQPQSSGPAISLGSADWITIQNFNIVSLCGDSATSCTATSGFSAISDTASLTDLSTHVTINNNQIDVGKLNGGGSLIILHAPQNWAITNNTFGPSCCGELAVSSPVGITIGKPNSATPDCTTEACNVDVNNNLFQYTDLRHASDWPTSGWPAPPGMASCTNTTLCHLDGVHVWGCEHCNFNMNKFYGVDCEGIYIESGVNSSINQDINIIGNSGTMFNDHCSGLIYVKVNGSTGNTTGTFNIGFNESPDLIEIGGGGFTGAGPGTVFNIYGNYANLLIPNTNGSNGGCFDGNPPNVTLNYYYNVWQNSLPGSTQGPCGATDKTGTTPGWVNSSAAPSVGLDMHKTGPAGVADNEVPCASLPSSLPFGGCPTTDTFGNTFVALADAGADQRSAVGASGPSIGDLNSDGHVNATDLSIILSHFGQSGINQAQGDINQDGVCNVTDLSILFSHYGS